MQQAESPFVVGIFEDRALAKQAVEELHHAGFRDDQIHVPISGASNGGFLNSFVNKLLGDDHHESLEVLADEGLPKAEADYYQQELEAGRTLVMVQAYGHQQQARDILSHYGAYNANTRSSPVENVHTVQLLEEVMQAQKNMVQVGEVCIRKVVVIEEKTITVSVKREDIVIERRAVSADAADQPMRRLDGRVIELGENESIRIPLRSEQIFIEKRPVVAEELLVSKRSIEETKHITDTIQREEAHLERRGKVTILGDPVDNVPHQDPRKVHEAIIPD